MLIPIKHPEWLEESHPGETLKAFREGKLPKGIAGWMLVVALKHPLRAIYGSDLRAAWALLIMAIQNKVSWRWFNFRCRFNLLSKEERLIRKQVEEDMGPVAQQNRA